MKDDDELLTAAPTIREKPENSSQGRIEPVEPAAPVVAPPPANETLLERFIRQGRRRVTFDFHSFEKVFTTDLIAPVLEGRDKPLDGFLDRDNRWIIDNKPRTVAHN